MSTGAPEPGLIAENAIERDVAVIDVGSNSVRLVHFRLEGRALWPIYNEKVMAGLGEGVRETGRLNPKGVDIALRALKRFQRLLDAKAVSDLHIVATAAVRNAEDGPDFVQQVAEQTGLEVRVLTGAQEGEMSALGLVAGIPDAHGMTGDLGGSSLEITPLVNGRPQAGKTFPLGPQEVLGAKGWEYSRAKRKIEKRLDGIDFTGTEGTTFYAVGGAWRALAQLAFARSGYPLRVVHQFGLDEKQARQLTRLAARLSPASLEGIPGIGRRRAATLPYAALLLRRLIKRGGFGRIVFSAYGLREGVIMAGQPESLRDQDPLVAGAEALARPAAPAPAFGRALAAWLRPVMEPLEPVFSPRRDWLLLEAASRLADMGARMHPDHRTDLARETVLYAPFAGIEHAERAFLAAVTHYRHGGSVHAMEVMDAPHLMSEAQHERAQFLGLALRLAAKLSGRSEALLGRFTLSTEADRLLLQVDESVRDLYVERSISQLGGLAGIIGRDAVVEYR